MMLAGALATAGLALLADGILAGLQHALTPAGRRRAR
jgi:ABC-type proline/glycine betaine transport system permease subunit